MNITDTEYDQIQTVIRGLIALSDNVHNAVTCGENDRQMAYYIGAANREAEKPIFVAKELAHTLKQRFDALPKQDVLLHEGNHFKATAHMVGGEIKSVTLLNKTPIQASEPEVGSDNPFVGAYAKLRYRNGTILQVLSIENDKFFATFNDEYDTFAEIIDYKFYKTKPTK